MKSYFDSDKIPRDALGPERREAARRRRSHPAWSNKYFRIGVTIFLTFVACVLFYYILFHTSDFVGFFLRIRNILMPVFVGLIIAYLLSPLVNYEEKHLLYPLCGKWKIAESRKREVGVRTVSILLSALLVILALYFLVALFLRQIIPSIGNLILNFDTYVGNFQSWLRRTLEDTPEISSSLSSAVNRYTDDLEKWMENLLTLYNPTDILKYLSTSFLSFLKGLWNFIIGFIISIYVLASKEKLVARAKKLTYAFFSRDTANRLVSSFRFTHRTFIGFISGKVLDSIIIGLLCFIGTSLLNTPYKTLISLIVGVTNFIPFFGPYIGAIPSAILVFIVDPMHPLNVVYFLIFIMILQQMDGNFIGPKILGSSTGLTGFWVIFSITLFGGLLGVFGMLIGVPVFAVLYAGGRHLTEILLKQKGYPCETDDYLMLGQMLEDGRIEEYLPPEKPKRERRRGKTR